MCPGRVSATANRASAAAPVLVVPRAGRLGLLGARAHGAPGCTARGCPFRRERSLRVERGRGDGSAGSGTHGEDGGASSRGRGSGKHDDGGGTSSSGGGTRSGSGSATSSGGGGSSEGEGSSTGASEDQAGVDSGNSGSGDDAVVLSTSGVRWVRVWLRGRRRVILGTGAERRRRVRFRLGWALGR